MKQQSNFSIVRFLALLAIAVLLVAVLFSRFGLFSVREDLKPGEPLPYVEAEGWLNGDPPSMEELKGKVVVVIAFAHWCLPCREDAPYLVELHEEFSKSGVEFIGLTSEDSSVLSETKEFLNDNNIPWLSGYGASNTLLKLKASYIPAVWVVGKDGVITWNIDSEREQSLKEAIEAALR